MFIFANRISNYHKKFRMKKRALLIVCFLSVILLINANVHPRLTYSINETWRFFKGDYPNAIRTDFDHSGYEIVNFPHTWNALDVLDETPGYYRDIAWYKRNIFIPKEKAENQVTIFFEGANQEIELFINGKSAGTHVGGYTRFSFDITKLLKFGEENNFSIKVNNRHNENIPPLSADFTFFGGIYRDVYLIYTNKQHISTTHYASPGIYISTPSVSKEQAKVNIKTILTNAESSSKRVIVEHRILNKERKTIASASKQFTIQGNRNEFQDKQEFTVKNPELWSPESPVLHTVHTRVYDARSKKLLDEITQPLGFRWYEFSAEKGFSLNGKAYKLIGTNRHQCYEQMGNALPDEIHVRDVILLKNMGGNFLRVSHYPQDPTVMEMCDKLGIITSVEIPIVNAITESEAFSRNCLEMTKEMVYQDFNRPSVLIWAYMNEVLLKVPYGSDDEKRQPYLTSVNKLATQIETLIREIDNQRYTLIPFHGNFNLYNEAGLSRIPMIAGWNLYQGWYGGKFDQFDSFLDEAQEVLKGIPFIITEYGADVDPRLHSLEPVRFDYTAEYANLYHEHYIKAIMKRPFVNGANIWNLNDFHSEERTYAVPHINNKGITSVNRELKDTYLQYKAMLSQEPVVLIGGSNWKIRGGNAGINHTCTQAVKVYSNLEKVELILNSVSLGYKNVMDNIAQFDVPFVNGDNVLEAVGLSEEKVLRDLLKVDFRLIPADLKDKELPFNEINVMLGSKRYFEDRTQAVIWLPEKEYSSGSWGYIGGINYVSKTRHGNLPASDLDIWGTTDDPIFQTQRIGIEAFKLDVPDGQYSISLYWAELQAGERQQLAYNLGNDILNDDFSERIFDVSINGQKVVSDLNIVEEYGAQRAVIKKFIIDVHDNQGITINFHPKSGESILNAIRVYRNY